MTALSFPVLCGAVLVLQSVLFTPALPFVTPDLHVELTDGDNFREKLFYETENVPYSNEKIRLKRQVTVPPNSGDESLPADKTLLNKNPSGFGTNTNGKKLIDSKVLATARPITDGPTPTAAGYGESGLPAQHEGNNSNHTAFDENNVDSIEPISDEDMFFDGNSTYPHPPSNNTYYEQNQNQSLSGVDDFRYYNVTYDTDGVRKYWIDMNANHKAKKHDMLSNAHRRAATVRSNFNITFYGHKVQNLTIATGGFIYLGEHVHAWLAATQYIAPLMANFDSSTSLNATVNYASDDDLFAVEWNQVRLQDSPGVGPFTFQTSIYKNGTIVFVYKNIPIPIENITDSNHPVKVGLSDAYIKDKNLLFVRQKTIYEYHRIDLKQHPLAPIVNGTAIIFTPAPTCIELLSCGECVKTKTPFKCSWCPTTNRCSNGTDRYFQDWTSKGCDKPNGNFTTEQQCIINQRDKSSYNSGSDHSRFDDHINEIHGIDENSSADSFVKKIKAPESEGMSAAGVIGVMFLCMIVFGAVGWLSYAYFFPHSPSGQLLIRYRPSQWAMRRGEARYTAASIHM